ARAGLQAAQPGPDLAREAPLRLHEPCVPGRPARLPRPPAGARGLRARAAPPPTQGCLSDPDRPGPSPRVSPGRARPHSVEQVTDPRVVRAPVRDRSDPGGAE